MKYVVGLLALAFAIALALTVLDSRENAYARKADAETIRALEAERDIALAKYAEAASSVQRVTDTVIRRITRYDTLRIRIPADGTHTDTVVLREFVAVVDSVVGSCRELVTSCALARRRADDVIFSFTVERDLWKRLYERRDRRREWTERALPIALISGAVLGAWIRGQ